MAAAHSNAPIEVLVSRGLPADHPRRGASVYWRRWVPAALLLGGLMLLARSLPLATGIDRLQRWVADLGLLGMIVFAATYVAAALLFVPGAALTIAAGALFGLIGGTVTVSLASTAAAGLAFLLARRLLRRHVEALARRHRAFAAVDSAVGDGGWKIVALLRLVPLFPFSAGNYLLGLTSARLWPYLAASWLFMLPGTLMYVYVGYLGISSLEAATSADATVGAWRIALLAAGLLALVLATVYLTRSARRRLRAYASLEDHPPETTLARPALRGGPATALLWAAAAAALTTGVWARANSQRLAGLFGPPVVQSRETFAGSQATMKFDHHRLDALLRRFVDPDGLVDYGGLRRAQSDLDAYLTSLADASLDRLGRDGRLALLLNAYNAFTLRLILDHYPIGSILDIPVARRWSARRWRLAGRTVSLDEIENELIRPNFKEPRIHFALVCAAKGCPRLRAEAYVPDRLEEQLADQARFLHSSDRWFRFDPVRRRVELTQIYQWYASDFEQAAGSVLSFVSMFVPAVQRQLSAAVRLEIGYLPYDWGLNTQTRK